MMRIFAPLARDLVTALALVGLLGVAAGCSDELRPPPPFETGPAKVAPDSGAPKPDASAPVEAGATDGP